MISVIVSDGENETGFSLAPELTDALLGGPRQQRKEVQKNIGRTVALAVQGLAVAPKGWSDAEKANEAEGSEEADQEVRSQ
jgi:hypothetical protein